MKFQSINSRRSLLTSFLFLGLIGVCATAQAQNLIVNPNFTAGNTGFSSSYSFVTSNLAVQEYGVVTDPKLWNVNLFSFGDHTTGTGNMMVVNGAAVLNVTVWTETIAVLPNTTYNFSAWVASAYNVSAPVMDFAINSGSLGTFTPVIAIPGTWGQFTAGWNSGAATSAVITIVDQNTDPNGNDVTIDDLSFAAISVVPEPGTLALLLPGVGLLGACVLRKRR